MNSREFYDKVCLMRRLQKEYFKTRSKSALQRSKDVEREIDAEIERVNAKLGINTPNYTQRNMFDNSQY